MKSSKYRHVRTELETAIRSGEFAVGEQLPTEQALAERFGVSYLTARRAVCELVEADLLERRARKQGTFVRPHGLKKLETTTLNLITSAYEGAFHRTFLEYGAQLAAREGWMMQVIRLSEGQQEPAVRAFKSDGFCLAMLDEFEPDGPIGRALRGTQGRAVLVGKDYSEWGIPSIWTNPRTSVQLAVSHLHAAGHRNLLLVMQDLEESLNRRHLQAWEAAMAGQFSGRELEARVIHVKTPQFHCPSRDAYLAVRAFLQRNPQQATAFVCFGDEVTQGLLAACHDVGAPVPSAFSVVNILDAPSMEFSQPAVTCVDVHFEAQMDIARKVFEETLEGKPVEPRLWNVPPRLIERESVAPPRRVGSRLEFLSRTPASRKQLAAVAV